MDKPENKQHILYFDILRIFATFAVMVVHVSASNWARVPVESFDWQCFNIYNSIVRWGVPVFVMISGALFLNGNQSIGKIHKKNVLRIITAFVFWSLLYGMIDFAQGASVRDTVIAMVQGHHHMWFLFMIVGLYLIVPFLRKIIESEELTKYFLILSFIITFIVPLLIDIVLLKSKTGNSLLRTVTNAVGLEFVSGYVFYFVLGYVINKKEIAKKNRMLIYILSILGFVFTIVTSSLVSIHKGTPEKAFYGNFTINVMLESIGLFVFFKYKFGNVVIRPERQKIILNLSKYSFGAYLVHAMIIEQLDKILNFDTLSFNAAISVPVISLIVFIISFAISYVFNKIPKLNKYIV